MRLIRDTNINFVGRRRAFFLFSAALLVVAVALYFVKGGFNYGVDFTGGTLLQVRFEEPVGVAGVRAAIEAVGEGGASIQQDDRGDFLIRVRAREFEGGESNFAAMVRDQFEAAFPGNQFEVLREETVGPRISGELQSKVLLAVLLGIVGILMYVSFRFDLRFGVAAVLALVHDALITLGFVLLFNKEITITVIAAILTVIGYSVNDSIVVSDRIREGMRKARKESFGGLVNRAINEVLNRTVVTTSTTLFVTLTMLTMGAAAIRDFAFVLTIGIVVGTYSSIFIVANTVVEWESRLPSKQRR